MMIIMFITYCVINFNIYNINFELIVNLIESILFIDKIILNFKPLMYIVWKIKYIEEYVDVNFIFKYF